MFGHLLARRPAATTLLLTLALGVQGCELWPADQGFPYTTTDPLTDFGMVTHELYAMVTYITVAIMAAVTVLMAYTLIAFRDDGKPENPKQIHGNTQMEIGWTLLPVLIVIVLIVPTVQAIFKIADAPPIGAVDADGELLVDADGNPLKPTVEIRVIGKRWWWAFEYVNEGITTGNHLVIPDDRPVSLFIESDTVIHSFWVPRLGGKRDAVPGRVNPLWFNMIEDVPPGQPLHLRGECAEYCGEAHSQMRFETLVLDGADYDTWVAEYQRGPVFADAAVRDAGEKNFAEAGCVACHAITGNAGAVGKIGPNLTYFGDRRYVGAGIEDLYGDIPAHDVMNTWIRDPNSLKQGTALLADGSPRPDGMMVPAAGPDGVMTTDELGQDKLDAIIAYLLAQKSSFPTPGVE